jgi:hypothetical protein
VNALAVYTTFVSEVPLALRTVRERHPAQNLTTIDELKEGKNSA